jgi:hypothetical protein
MQAEAACFVLQAEARLLGRVAVFPRLVWMARVSVLEEFEFAVLVVWALALAPS